MRRYACALLRDRHEADDLVQDSLVRALGGMDARRDGEMRPWLFSIMHNLAVSRWRRWKASSPVFVDTEWADVAVAASQEASAELRDAMRALATLSDDQRQVLLLVAVEGFEYAQVASMLGLPIGTVMSRLSRARDKMRDFMDGRTPPALRSVG